MLVEVLSIFAIWAKQAPQWGNFCFEFVRVSKASCPVSGLTQTQ